MFGLGFSEILLICAIALIVLGPKHLPEAARTAGKLTAEFRRTLDELRREFNVEKSEITHLADEIKTDASNLEDKKGT